MGLIEELRGRKICLDTAPIIYFIEEHETYRKILRPVFVEIDVGNIEAITSTLTLLEVLVHPFRAGNQVLAEKYREILLSSAELITFEISHEISEMASRLRAKYSIRTPDAIQIKTTGLSLRSSASSARDNSFALSPAFLASLSNSVPFVSLS